MKKIALIIVITILSILTISLGVGTVYFATNYASAQDKIEDLEDDIDELKDELKDNQNNSYAVSNNSDSNDLYNNDYQEEKEENQENESSNDNYNNLQEIKLVDLEYLINQKENFILLVSQTTCSYCIEYKPTLNSVLNSHNLKAYYIEKNLLTKDENTSFSQIIETPGTPTTAFFIKGVEDQENRIVGNSGESVIEAHLKSAGFIR